MKTIHNKEYSQLISELREGRLTAGLSQAQAAKRMGMSRVWVGKIERRELRLDVLHFVAMCNAYGLRAHRLVRRLETTLLTLVAACALCTPVSAMYVMPQFDLSMLNAAVCLETNQWSAWIRARDESELTNRLRVQFIETVDSRLLAQTLCGLTPEMTALIAELFEDEGSFLSDLSAEITEVQRKHRHFGISDTQAIMFGIEYYNWWVESDNGELLMVATVTSSTNPELRTGDRICSCQGLPFLPGYDLGVMMAADPAARSFTMMVVRDGDLIVVVARARLVAFSPSDMQRRRYRDAVEAVVLRKLISTISPPALWW